MRPLWLQVDIGGPALEAAREARAPPPHRPCSFLLTIIPRTARIQRADCRRFFGAFSRFRVD